jgi:hypothetical protein
VQALIDAYLDTLPTCTVVCFPADFDASALDLHGRTAGVVDYEIVEYRDAAGVVLLRHTLAE